MMTRILKVFAPVFALAAAIFVFSANIAQAECHEMPGHPCADHDGLSEDELAKVRKQDVAGDKAEEKFIWQRITRHKCLKPTERGYDKEYCRKDDNFDGFPDWKAPEREILKRILADGGKFNEEHIFHCYLVFHNKSFCTSPKNIQDQGQLDKFNRRNLTW